MQHETRQVVFELGNWSWACSATVQCLLVLHCVQLYVAIIQIILVPLRPWAWLRACYEKNPATNLPISTTNSLSAGNFIHARSSETSSLHIRLTLHSSWGVREVYYFHAVPTSMPSYHTARLPCYSWNTSRSQANPRHWRLRPRRRALKNLWKKIAPFLRWAVFVILLWRVVSFYWLRCDQPRCK